MAGARPARLWRWVLAGLLAYVAASSCVAIYLGLRLGDPQIWLIALESASLMAALVAVLAVLGRTHGRAFALVPPWSRPPPCSPGSCGCAPCWRTSTP